MTIPARFTFKVPTSRLTYLAEKSPEGLAYSVLWPKHYPGDPGVMAYPADLVEKFVRGTAWVIVSNLDEA